MSRDNQYLKHFNSIDMSREINYLKPAMKIHKWGGLWFLLLLLIIVVSLISGEDSALFGKQKPNELSSKAVPLFAPKETEVLLRVGKHEGFTRLVFEAEKSFINATKVSTFPSQVKIEFPEPFNLKAPKEFPFEVVLTDKSLEVNLNKEGKIKFSRLSFPARLVFDIEREKQPIQVLSKVFALNAGQSGHDFSTTPADMKENDTTSGREKLVAQSEEDEETEVQAPPTPPTPTPPSEIKPPETKGEVPAKPVPPKAEIPKAEKKPVADVSFFFDDADVYEVIQTIFGEVLKVNYIVDPKIKGRVNFRTTTPVPRDQVLPVMEIILRLNGIAVVEENGLYRIISITDIPKEPAPIRFGRDPEGVELKGIAIVQVVQLKYIGSSEIIKILTPLLSQGGSIIDVPPSFLIIADTDANVKRLLQMVDIFDSEKLRAARPQVFVYPVQNSKAKDVANMLQQIFLGAKPSAAAPAKAPTAGARAVTPAPTPSPTPAPSETGGEALVSEITRIFADEVTNSIIILATPEDFTKIAEAIKKIDIVPRQVVIEALVARIDLTGSLSFGLAWSLKSNISIKSWPFERGMSLDGEMGQRPNALLPPTGATALKLSGEGFTYLATDPSGIVRAKLEALATEGKVKVMASPHILVSDNREARIQVGQQVPIKTSDVYQTGTTVAQTTYQYKDIGIILKVKPQINESGLVSLELTQEISSLATDVAAVAAGAEAVINKTEATTNLVAQDGQTIIIGGLMREDVTTSRSGIPFLSKIPILGYLFSSTSQNTTNIELMVLLTPHVVRNQQEAKGVTSDYINRFIKTTKEIKLEEFIKGKGK